MSDLNLEGPRYQQLLDTEHEMQQAEDNLKAFCNNFTNGEMARNDIRGIVNIALRSLEHLRKFVAPALDSIPLEERRTRGSGTSAVRVFMIPELLEIIFGFCRPIDILRLRTANICDKITGVTNEWKWQVYMGLQAGSKFSLPAQGLASDIGIDITTKLVENRAQSHDRCSLFFKDRMRIEIESVNTLDDCRRIYESLTDHEKDMLIMQPPIRQLMFSVSCCKISPAHFGPSPFGRRRSFDINDIGKLLCTISVESGFTIGRLLEVLVQIQEEHRVCANVAVEDLDEDGFFNPKIQALGRGLITEDDPEINRRIANATFLQKVDREKCKRLSPYVQAKGRGRFLN